MYPFYMYIRIYLHIDNKSDYMHNDSMLPCNVRMRSPVCGFHILILLSSDPEAIVLPTGKKVTELTLSLWPDETYIDTLNIFICIDTTLK